MAEKRTDECGRDDCDPERGKRRVVARAGNGAREARSRGRRRDERGECRRAGRERGDDNADEPWSNAEDSARGRAERDRRERNRRDQGAGTPKTAFESKEAERERDHDRRAKRRAQCIDGTLRREGKGARSTHDFPRIDCRERSRGGPSED